jgi:superfamily II DNA or RNA helicase
VWQLEAYGVAMSSIRSSEHHVIQACTGAGKTYLQGAICRTILATLKPGWVIINTAPRVSLVEQTAEAYEKIMPGEVGTWYGRRKRLSRLVVACQSSADTLADEIAARGLRVAFWLADEVHRADTDRLLESIERLAPRTRLGLTATPFRADARLSLRGWSRLAYSYPIDRAITEGVLVPWAPVSWAGDLECGNVATLQMIQESAPPGPGLVSAADITDATWYAEYLSEAGVPAQAIHSKLSKKEQKSRIAGLLSGELRCLAHVDLLTEGVDLPPLRWLAMRRSRGSAVAIVQEVGRILRTCEPDQWGEKTVATVLMPRPTPILESVGRDPALQAELLRKAAESEVSPKEETDEDPVETLISDAIRRGDVANWLNELAIAVQSQGVEVRTPDLDRPEVAITSKQYRAVMWILANRRRAGVRLFPGRVREVMYSIMKYPSALTALDASRLLAVVYGAGERYRSEYQRTHRHWRVSPDGLPSAGWMG